MFPLFFFSLIQVFMKPSSSFYVPCCRAVTILPSLLTSTRRLCLPMYLQAPVTRSRCLRTSSSADPHPIVLRSGNYIINERLKRIVEQKDALESGQGGGRQVRSVNIDVPKMHFVTQKAHRQDVRVYRVDVDFRNVFNATSQAALWHGMNMFHIPDVDFLE